MKHSGTYTGQNKFLAAVLFLFGINFSIYDQRRIQVNDVIVSVNGKPAISALETMDQVAEIRPGSEIPVEVMRDDKKLKLQVTIQEYPATN